MNHMTIDSMSAPWWDDYEWVTCPICEGEGYFYGSNSCKQCPHCEGDGEIKQSR
jgi:DnaJ-class molecular chaperone